MRSPGLRHSGYPALGTAQQVPRNHLRGHELCQARILSDFSKLPSSARQRASEGVNSSDSAEQYEM